jgi:hypothetical protein
MASLQVTQEQERITSPPMASLLCPPYKAVMYDQYGEPDKVLRYLSPSLAIATCPVQR